MGGGLAGGLGALAFADRGFDIVLVDAQEPEAMLDDAFDGRTTAVAYACARMLKRLDLWPLLETAAGPINDILVTDGDVRGSARSSSRLGGVSGAFMHFDSRELEPQTPLGWIVENAVFRRAIYQRLAENDRVSIHAPARVRSIRYGPAAVEIDADDAAISASLLVAADGRQSSVRASAGLKTSHWRYPQVGIIATVAHERPHDGVAQELFLPSGPFAVLPMTGDRSSLVWTERESQAPYYLSLDDAAFVDAIRDRMGDYLGGLTLAGPRGGYPLGLTLSHRFVAPRLVLIGDAARAIHPIAGQGFNLGVKDIAALTDVLSETRGVGLDIGGLAPLERYERWRRFDSTFLALGTDILNRLFSNDVGPIRAARRAGLSAVQAAGPLRRFFMRQAGADVGELPSLLRA